MVKIKTLLTADENKFRRQGQAKMLFALNADTYRLTVDGAKHFVGHVWTPGQAVYEVNHVSGRQIRLGDILALTHIDGQILAHLAVLEIIMVNGEDLTNKEITDLGYENQENCEKHWGLSLSGKKWYIRVQKLTPQA